MKIIISSIVTLNGGDYAILEAMMKVLKATYGNHTEFIVYDLHAEVASRYYPGIQFRSFLYDRYKKQHRYLKALAVRRMLLAARLFKSGNAKLARLLLTSDERIDFDHYTSSDLIIATGGTYLVENYSMRARIFDYNFTIALGKPLIFFTQSLGPFNKPENQKDMRRIFNEAQLILLRDQASHQNLRNIGVDISRAKICSDVVFADTSLQTLEEAKHRPMNEKLKVGISVRDWNHFRTRTKDEGTRLYYQSVAAICEYITLELGGEVIFVSTCQAIKEYHTDDSKTAEQICQLLSRESRTRTYVNNSFMMPAELKKVIGGLDLMISTRMHGAIQALSMGVPVLPIAYEFKTIELFRKLINESFILDIETINPTVAVNVTQRFLNALPELRGHLFERVKQEYQSSLKPIDYLKDVYV